MELPTRRTNPFATCWTDPATAPFHVLDEAGLDRVLKQLGELKCGAIVGPHGSGKTTLARRIADRLEAENWAVQWIEYRDGASGSDWPTPMPPPSKEKRLLIVDGYEQLSCWRRWRLRRACRRQSVTLLVTSHSPTAVPTLERLTPQLEVALAICRDLTSAIETRVAPQDVETAFAECGGNLRDMLFRLYDLHEIRRR